MTIAVDLGLKATKQTKKQKIYNLMPLNNCVSIQFVQIALIVRLDFKHYILCIYLDFSAIW